MATWHIAGHTFGHSKQNFSVFICFYTAPCLNGVFSMQTGACESVSTFSLSKLSICGNAIILIKVETIPQTVCMFVYVTIDDGQSVWKFVRVLVQSTRKLTNKELRE